MLVLGLLQSHHGETYQVDVHWTYLIVELFLPQCHRLSRVEQLRSSRRLLRPRLPAVRGLVERLRRVHCPALRGRCKVERLHIRAQFDGVVRPVLAAIAGAIDRALGVLIAPDIIGIVGDPAVSSVNKIDRLGRRTYGHRGCGVPASSSIMGEVDDGCLVCETGKHNWQNPIGRSEKNRWYGRNLAMASVLC